MVVRRILRVGEPLRKLAEMDYTTAVMYLGLFAWGIANQAVPPTTLLGAAGESVTRVVVLIVLVSSIVAFFGFLTTRTARDEDAVLDWELPASLMLVVGWGTYCVIVWLIILDPRHGGGPPPIPGFGVLLGVVESLLLVRLVILIVHAVRTVRNGLSARRQGIEAPTAGADL